MIAVIDYGAGNLRSIRRALESAGATTVVTDDTEVIATADAVVLPGVGNAGHAVERLKLMGMDRAVYRAVDAGKPFLGICVGMQVLFEEQEEGGVNGLSLLPGRVRSLGGAVKVPHMGWNRSRVVRSGPAGEPGEEPYFYFVHSYVAEPADGADIAATSHYGEDFPSVVVRDNVWGTQFHPEKSGTDGLAFVRRFVAQLDEAALTRDPIGATA
ncbi:MAG: imidazole glycerol-phosphate synthase subunit HisH [Thermomicrobiales bacterium]|jgi:glutamine amidotransferase|nr:imidazole glycerol-phosphate synthase subunit HisH [Thermomicrobiales bacterium]